MTLTLYLLRVTAGDECFVFLLPVNQIWTIGLELSADYLISHTEHRVHKHTYGRTAAKFIDKNLCDVTLRAKLWLCALQLPTSLCRVTASELHRYEKMWAAVQLRKKNDTSQCNSWNLYSWLLVAVYGVYTVTVRQVRIAAPAEIICPDWMSKQRSYKSSPSWTGGNIKKVGLACWSLRSETCAVLGHNRKCVKDYAAGEWLNEHSFSKKIRFKCVGFVNCWNIKVISVNYGQSMCLKFEIKAEMRSAN